MAAGRTSRDLDAAVRRDLTLRAARALQIYRRYPRAYDEAGYPFAQRPEDGSVRSPRASRIRQVPGRNAVEISVTSRGAVFEEYGDDDNGSKEYIEGNLRLPLRGGAASRGVRGRVEIIDGKPYLAVQRVRTYRGRFLLRKAIAAAFTGRATRA